MTIEEIINQIIPLFRDILDNDAIVLSPNTTAKDIEEWDSLNNIQLVVAVEKHFKIRFTSAEIQNFKNVGEMCDSISKKLG